MEYLHATYADVQSGTSNFRVARTPRMLSLTRVASHPALTKRVPVCMAQATATATGGTSHVGESIGLVLTKLSAAVAKRETSHKVRLVAVSKTKPVELLKEAYEAGQRDFGENYVQELVDKAPELPQDVRWHFIGHLQSNKVKVLIEGVPNLAAVETVDSEKLAARLNNAVGGAERPRLPVFVQVNTSGEESKFGVEPEGAVPLARYIAEQCSNLRLAGLMTIGQPDYSSRPENFTCLVQCRKQVEEALALPPESLELSMGMSGDFEQAVEMGSTNVRVGSTIFGARDYSK